MDITNINKGQIILSYEGTNVLLDFSGKVMVNATEMSKRYNKQPAHFLRMEQTQDFINELVKRYNLSYNGNDSSNSHYAISHSEIVKTVNGGKDRGTWMERKLALKFAGWLSPAFEVWLFEQLENLLFQEVEIHNSYFDKKRPLVQRRKELLADIKVVDSIIASTDHYKERQSLKNELRLVNDKLNALEEQNFGQTALFLDFSIEEGGQNG